MLEKYFLLENIQNTYYDSIFYSSVVGIDKMTSKYFFKNIDENIKSISKDIISGNYEFKSYKVSLIPKNFTDPPRKVCIPTIKDRIVIEILKEIIYDSYEGYKINNNISSIIFNFTADYRSNNYKYYFKTDISTFFDAIDHKILIKKLKKIIKDDGVIKIINDVLKNTQIYNGEKIKSTKGIPQGLAISTLLANIYLMDLDRDFQEKKNIKYYRYVDDIFIFGNNNIFVEKEKLIYKIKRLKLKVNKKKTITNKIGKEFNFLGYKISNDCISVKDKSIKKIETSIENIFKKYSKDKNKESLEFKLNTRITGIIIDNKKYGWLFYFSNIDNMELLYHLDKLVTKLKYRYNVTDIKTKSFVKTYHKIKKSNFKKSNYFLNLNVVTESEKRQILKNISRMSEEEINTLSPSNLDYYFKKEMFKCLKELERDLDSIS